MPESQQTTNNSVQYKYDWNHCVPHYLQPDGLASHHSSNSALLFISAKVSFSNNHLEYSILIRLTSSLATIITDGHHQFPYVLLGCCHDRCW